MYMLAKFSPWDMVMPITFSVVLAVMVYGIIWLHKTEKKTDEIQKSIEKKTKDGKEAIGILLAIEQTSNSNSTHKIAKVSIEILSPDEPPFTISATTAIDLDYKSLFYPGLKLDVIYNPQDLEVIAVKGFVDKPYSARIVKIISCYTQRGSTDVHALLEISPDGKPSFELEGEFRTNATQTHLANEGTVINIRYNPEKTPAIVQLEKKQPLTQLQQQNDCESRLEKLKRLFDKDLITKEEYQTKKQEILADL